MYMKTDSAPDVTGSFGRILNYVPPLNSKMPPGNTATFVNYTNTVSPMRYAYPSYNVEIMPFFLRGIITETDLPNRNVLRNVGIHRIHSG
jgi:hypothetical protein